MAMTDEPDEYEPEELWTVIAIYPDGRSESWHSCEDALPGYSERKGGSILRLDGDPWQVTKSIDAADNVRIIEVRPA